jgi:hypothetical protein
MSANPDAELDKVNSELLSCGASARQVSNDMLLVVV